MPLRPPTREDLHQYAEELDLDLRDEEVAAFLDRATAEVSQYETVDAYEPPVPLGGDEVRERSAGRRASPEDDPHNAWVSRCEIRGGTGGPLAGWDVAIKDNVCVAGVEMTCGSAVLEGYVPDVDATIVTRLLDAGARIVGKTNMDDMAMSTSGHSAFGAIRNPHDEDYLAGGSSGGSAVAVATGEVDAAIGTDQGGSIRIPAAHCGVVGLKPTYGLVPYTGSVGLEHVVDHPGPLGPDVETVASVLSTIAGTTEYDARQPAAIEASDYTADLDDDPGDVRIGVLVEGFDQPGTEPAIGDRVRETLAELADAGAVVEEVSIPMHADAATIHSVVSAEGLVAAFRGEGLGHGAKGWYNTGWVEAFGKFRRAHGGEFPPTLKYALLLGAYTSDRYHSRYYARGMNLVMELVDRYEVALSEYDLLAMPTVTETAPERDPERDALDRLTDGQSLGNTAAFNRTGHPAISVPAGTVDGLPVGLMLVGDRFDDATVLDVAAAVETRS